MFHIVMIILYLNIQLFKIIYYVFFQLLQILGAFINEIRFFWRFFLKKLSKFVKILDNVFFVYI